MAIYSMLLMMFLLLTAVLQVQMQPLAEQEPEAESSGGDMSRALYDQRQTGKYNIHVSIKDVAIIEVDQNELADESYNVDDDDYYYDDGALTIKPIKFTTTTAAPPPTTTTAATTTTTTTSPPETTTVAVVAIAPPSSNMSSYSAQLLADIAATQHQRHHQRPKANNLIIMETPIGPGSSSPSTLLPKWLHARSKDEPITTTTTTTTTRTTPNIEYTPAQGHDSPIFKVKVQRAATPTKAAPTEAPLRACRTHQFRDAQGKCRSKRSGSILRKLFSMLVSLPFAGNRHAHHANGLQISP